MSRVWPLRSLLLTLIVAAPALTFCQSAPSHSDDLRVFDPSLVDKSVDPCDNFYRYSCNDWFKKNPLPPDQIAYGRFTELDELNRLHLKQILEQAAVPSPARTANEQKIGDEYASCMDTAAIDKPGLAPLQPELDRIAALKSAAGLPALLAHLHAIGVNAFFDMGSSQDYADASSVISAYGAGGLGLPERDYYTRTDAKSVEQRQQYVDHVPSHVRAGRRDRSAGRRRRRHSSGHRNAAGQSIAHHHRGARPAERSTTPPTSPRFGRADAFLAADYVAADHAPAAGKANDRAAKVFCRVQRAAGATRPLDQIRTYLRWHLLHAFAATSMPASFEKETWTSTRTL